MMKRSDALLEHKLRGGNMKNHLSLPPRLKLTPMRVPNPRWFTLSLVSTLSIKHRRRGDPRMMKRIDALLRREHELRHELKQDLRRELNDSAITKYPVHFISLSIMYQRNLIEFRKT
jgi:hypothetical protein